MTAKQIFYPVLIALVAFLALYLYFTRVYEGDVSFQAQSLDISDELNFNNLKSLGSMTTKITTIDGITQTSKSLQFISVGGDRMQDALKQAYTTLTCIQTCPNCATALGCEPQSDGTCSVGSCNSNTPSCELVGASCMRVVQ